MRNRFFWKQQVCKQISRSRSRSFANNKSAKSSHFKASKCLLASFTSKHRGARRIAAPTKVRKAGVHQSPPETLRLIPPASLAAWPRTGGRRDFG